MRSDWSTYFAEIARVVASRGTCDRRQVGCVFVRARQILVTGYNGALAGQAHCDEEGHDMLEGHCVRTVHAEANAIAQAARRGISLDGSVLYTTTYPCWDCLKLVVAVGVPRVYFLDEYPQPTHTMRAQGLVDRRVIKIQRLEDICTTKSRVKSA